MYTVVIYRPHAWGGLLPPSALQGLGLRVVEVESRPRLVSLCRRERVLLVVLLGAAELLASIEGVPSRRDGARPSLFLISWHHSASVAHALLEQGIDQCMTFPVSLGRLRRKVRELIPSQAYG